MSRANGPFQIETKLRTRMTEERLSDLALLSIEQEVAEILNMDSIMEEFESLLQLTVFCFSD